MSNQQLLQLFQQSWAKNKYWVMGRSQQAYNQIRLLAKHNQWTEEKQRTYEAILASLATVPRRRRRHEWWLSISGAILKKRQQSKKKQISSAY